MNRELFEAFISEWYECEIVAVRFAVRVLKQGENYLCLRIPEIAQMELYLNFVLVLCFIETVQIKRRNTIYTIQLFVIQTLRNKYWTIQKLK